jgi:hypothetical protein
MERDRRPHIKRLFRKQFVSFKKSPLLKKIISEIFRFQRAFLSPALSLNRQYHFMISSKYVKPSYPHPSGNTDKNRRGKREA